MNDSKRKIEVAIRNGLDAEARIQKTIKLIQKLLKMIELSPETDEWGINPAREHMKEVEGYLIDLIFDGVSVHDSFTTADEVMRGVVMAYDNLHDQVPEAYRMGRQEALRSLQASLDDESYDTLRFIAFGLAELDEETRYATRLRLHSNMEQK